MSSSRYLTPFSPKSYVEPKTQFYIIPIYSVASKYSLYEQNPSNSFQSCVQPTEIILRQNGKIVGVLWVPHKLNPINKHHFF